VQTVPSARATPRWVYALWKLWMVGEAFNTVTPLASFGGEPVKAALLKKHYRVDLREATAALVLAQTINIMALVLFLVAGFVLMLRSQVIPSTYRATAGSALGVFAGCVLLCSSPSDTGCCRGWAASRARVSAAARRSLSSSSVTSRTV